MGYPKWEFLDTFFMYAFFRTTFTYYTYLSRVIRFYLNFHSKFPCTTLYAEFYQMYPCINLFQYSHYIHLQRLQ